VCRNRELYLCTYRRLHFHCAVYRARTKICLDAAAAAAAAYVLIACHERLFLHVFIFLRHYSPVLLLHENLRGTLATGANVGSLNAAWRDPRTDLCRLFLTIIPVRLFSVAELLVAFAGGYITTTKLLVDCTGYTSSFDVYKVASRAERGRQRALHVPRKTWPRSVLVAGREGETILSRGG